MRADVWRGGTPEYAPPEMLTHDIAGIETRRLSPTVDIYALSSVLYELYCGHTPFNLKALGTASPYRVKTETAFEIPQARTAADEALVSIIVAGLAVDQERRPSVEQMLDLLRRWQSSELGDWPTPEPVWGSRVMDAQTTYIGPGASIDEPVPATFDTAQPVMFPLDDNDVSAPADPFAAAPDAAAEDAPLDHGHRDHASYLPVPVVLEAPRAAYGADAAVSTAASMPAAPGNVRNAEHARTRDARGRHRRTRRTKRDLWRRGGRPFCIRWLRWFRRPCRPFLDSVRSHHDGRGGNVRLAPRFSRSGGPRLYGTCRWRRLPAVA